MLKGPILQLLSQRCKTTGVVQQFDKLSCTMLVRTCVQQAVCELVRGTCFFVMRAGVRRMLLHVVCVWVCCLVYTSELAHELPRIASFERAIRLYKKHRNITNTMIETPGER